MNSRDLEAEGLAGAGAETALRYSVGPKEVATDDPKEIARDVAAVSRLGAVPTLLEVLSETTGMGFTAVARVTEKPGPSVPSRTISTSV